MVHDACRQGWGRWGSIGSPRLQDWLDAYAHAREARHFAKHATALIRFSVAGPSPWLAWAHRAREAGEWARKLDRHRSAAARPVANVDLDGIAWATVAGLVADATRMHPAKLEGLGLYESVMRRANRPDLEADFQAMRLAVAGREHELERAIVTALHADSRCALVARDALAAVVARNASAPMGGGTNPGSAEVSAKRARPKPPSAPDRARMALGAWMDAHPHSSPFDPNSNKFRGEVYEWVKENEPGGYKPPAQGSFERYLRGGGGGPKSKGP